MYVYIYIYIDVPMIIPPPRLTPRNSLVRRGSKWRIPVGCTWPEIAILGDVSRDTVTDVNSVYIEYNSIE